MNLFGLTISRQQEQKDLSPVTPRGGWHTLIREAWTGAWQQNVTISYDTVLTHHAVFACQTLIASESAIGSQKAKKGGSSVPRVPPVSWTMRPTATVTAATALRASAVRVPGASSRRPVPATGGEFTDGANHFPRVLAWAQSAPST